MTGWTDRVRAAAGAGLPFEDNETSYRLMRDTYGFEFDENLTPIRGRERNYAVGPFSQGWWCFYYPSHEERSGRSHPFEPWGDRIVAAIQKGSTAGYGGDALPQISFSMNLLPFLAGGQQVVADALASLGPASHRILGENWAKVYRPAYGKIKKIVYWRPNGVYGGEITPAAAVRVIEQAFRLSGITVVAVAPAVANINDKGAKAMDERDKGNQQPGLDDSKPSTDKFSLTLSEDTVLSPLSANKRLEVWQLALPLDSPATRAVLRKRMAGTRPGTGKLVLTAGDAAGGTLYYKGEAWKLERNQRGRLRCRSYQSADGYRSSANNSKRKERNEFFKPHRT